MIKVILANLMAVTLFFTVQVLAADLPKNIIAMDLAKKIALESASGSVKSSELEFEKHQWVYSFDIISSDQKIHEVMVNAKSGKIVSNTIESATEEAKEEAEDKK